MPLHYLHRYHYIFLFLYCKNCRQFGERDREIERKRQRGGRGLERAGISTYYADNIFYLLIQPPVGQCRTLVLSDNTHSHTHLHLHIIHITCVYIYIYKYIHVHLMCIHTLITKYIGRNYNKTRTRTNSFFFLQIRYMLIDNVDLRQGNIAL